MDWGNHVPAPLEPSQDGSHPNRKGKPIVRSGRNAKGLARASQPGVPKSATLRPGGCDVGVRTVTHVHFLRARHGAENPLDWGCSSTLSAGEISSSSFDARDSETNLSRDANRRREYS